MRTSTLGRVEREVVWCWIRVADAGSGAHQSLREVLDLPRVLIKNHDQSIALLHGDGDRFLEAFFVGRLGHFHAVYNHFDVVIFVTVNLHALNNLQHLSVYSDMQIAFAAHALEELAVVTLTTANHGC